MKKAFNLSLFLFLVLYVNSQINPYYQQHIVYTMDIDVNLKNYTYKGKQNIVYTNNSPDVLKVVYFHLYWNAFQPNSMMDQRIQYLGKEADRRMTKDIEGKRVSRIKDLATSNQGYQKVVKLSQNGKPIKYQVQGTILVVQIAEPILPGKSTTFDMEWIAQVPEQIRRSGRNNAEGIALSMTQWYPKMAEYDYDGWHTWDYVGREFQGVFGDFNVNITIDKEYIIGAGGVLQNPLEVKGYDSKANITPKNNKVTWKWTATNIHDFAWAADPDYKVELVEVPNGPKVYLVYQDNANTQVWKKTKPKIREYFALMNNNFGKYLYPTYSFIQGGDGGMEYGMCTLILGNTKDVEGLCGLMFHEASHSWYNGMLATNESMRAWMDEGFTTYAEEFCMSKIFSKQYKDQPHFMYNNTLTLAQIQKAGREELASKFADYYETSVGYSIAAYIKGSVFLSQLGYIIGEENLQTTLLAYYNTWKLKHPTDRDFIHIAQITSEMDLNWYLNYHIYTTEKIDYALGKVSAKNNETQISLKRIEKFPMPIDLYITLQSGEKKLFTIPLNITRGSKTKGNGKAFTPLPYWEWTAKDYTAIIPINYNNITKIEIDASGRLADVNRENNVWVKQ